MKTSTLLFLSLSVLLFACKKNDSIPLTGKYRGDYIHYYPHQSSIGLAQEPVTVEFSGNHGYKSSGTHDRMPAGGSGFYTFADKRTIDFRDENVWTADFDWNRILNGKFSYEFRNDSLILTRYHTPCTNCDILLGFYQYRLKRVN